MVKKKNDIQYYEAVGRRRESVARVRLHIVTAKDKSVTASGTKMNQGDIIVNEKPFDMYFPSIAERNIIMRPLEVTQSTDRFAITVQTKGGGKSGQVDAILLGIARALCLSDETYRALLKPEGALTRDPRIRERRMVGTGGKSRRQKQSPKR
ncbi:30S ribosomal protein S9 [Candidatus Woesebacteria bacterium]|nr:30S ribosomal protein S9 [Candidatus Woesebacteria bacterium]